MRLAEAIKRAEKWVSKEGIISGIRLVPAQWGDERSPLMDTQLLLPTVEGEMRERVYKAILGAGPKGLTDDEAEVLLDLPHQTVSARRNELMHSGHIRDSGKKRDTRAGGSATVWTAVVERMAFPDFPAYVMATDGHSGIVILVDPPDDVPNTVVDGKDLAKAVRALKKDPFQIKRTGKSSVSVERLNGETLFNLFAWDPSSYPALPAFPTKYRAIEPIDVVRSVVHAAGDDDDRPELSCVHLTREFTEATDQSRVARVSIGLTPNGKGHLVHKALFKNFPKKMKHLAGFALEHGNAYLHVDGELRFVRASTDENYFDLSQMVPERWFGSRVQIGVVALKQSIKLATSASARDWVRLRFLDGVIEVAGLDDNGAIKYHDEIRTHSSSHSRNPTNPVEVVVRGRLLWNSLHALGEEIVTLGFASSDSPLRLERGNYVESFWPLIRQG